VTIIQSEESPMNAFDKLCAVPAFILGLILLVLGAFGLFAGCRANFTLPPILGVIPALVGWGIVRAVYFGWNRPDSPPGSVVTKYGAAADGGRSFGP
jgi:hypothetical protein